MFHNPGIGLYDPDESNPGAAGSYAGACAFYTAIFKKPADSIKFNYSLSATDAANIRKAATKVVYDSLRFWHIGQYETIAGFTHNANGMLPVKFTNKSVNAANYNWDFVDGNTSTAATPTHTYTLPGTYAVRLIATGTIQCSDTTYTMLILQSTGLTNLAKRMFSITPNPSHWVFTLKLEETNNSETTTLCIYDMMGRYTCNKWLHLKTLLTCSCSTCPMGLII